jgi:hypothetical protein
MPAFSPTRQQMIDVACAEFGNRKTGLRVLDLARERLEGSGMKHRSAFFRRQSELIEQCSRRLEDGKKSRPGG